MNAHSGTLTTLAATLGRLHSGHSKQSPCHQATRLPSRWQLCALDRPALYAPLPHPIYVQCYRHPLRRCTCHSVTSLDRIPRFHHHVACRSVLSGHLSRPIPSPSCWHELVDHFLLPLYPRQFPFHQETIPPTRQEPSALYKLKAYARSPHPISALSHHG